MPMEKTEKSVRLCNAQGQRISSTLEVVREHYLRDDVPCYSPLCLSDCQRNQDPALISLPCDVTHYLVPDCSVARTYLEILEDDHMRGIIFTRTVMQHVQTDGGRRLYNRLQSIMKEPHKGCVTFHNEFQKYAYCPRQPGEKTSSWQQRNIFSACEWFSNHLAAQIPIIMLTCDEGVVEEYSLRNTGVHVLMLEKYLSDFLPDSTNLHEMLRSLSASIKNSLQDCEHSVFLPSADIEEGLRSGVLVQGAINVNKHNAMNEAFVRPSGRSERSTKDDVLIVGSARNRAIHGDLVVVEILPKHLWRPRSQDIKENQTEVEAEKVDEDGRHGMPTGRVVGILQRRWRDYVASFEQAEESKEQKRRAGKVLVVPMDWRIPKIRISTTQADALRDHRIIVRIDSWELGSQYPNGHFVKSLGPAGQLETEIAVILTEYNLKVPPFSDGLLAEMPINSESAPWVMDPEEIKQRRDLRKSHLIFSIDPKGCEDVDDALSVQILRNGDIELGVHIADVTHFVKPSSLADHEAQLRSTTVYLADRRYDMLPAVLSADLCSLLSGVDRYAVSVIWTLDANCEVKKVWYGRTVIHSTYKLFYEMAQKIHDGATDKEIFDNVPELQKFSDKDKKIGELRSAVNNLMATARKIQEKRTKQGALQLEGVEVQVQIDKDSKEKDISDIVPKEALEIHETIAECMIFANHWVAKKICETYPSHALLRHHPLPRQEDFSRLRSCASVKGFSVETSDNQKLAQTLDACVLHEDPTFNKLLRSLATQAMSNASYFSTGSLARDQFFHYGLALPHYTHFTSPIRRYADILVHRQLLAAVGTAEEDQLPKNTQLQEIADHINTKHKMAQDAQKQSVLLFQCLYFNSRPEDDPSRVTEAVIFTIRANGLLVYVPRYGMRGAVYLKQKDGKVVFCSEKDVEWVGGTIAATDSFVDVCTPLGDQRYTLMDHISVRIVVKQSHSHGQDILLHLASNKPPQTPKQEDSKSIQHQIIQQVTDEMEKTRSAVDLGPKFDLLQAEYGQTPSKNSFYCLLQDIQQMALHR